MYCFKLFFTDVYLFRKMNKSDGNSNLCQSKVIIHVISGLTNYIFLLLLNMYIKSTFCDKVSFKVKSKSVEDPYIYL